MSKATEIVVEAGAHFVKTAVGLRGPTKIEHVRIMKEVVGQQNLVFGIS